MAAMRLLRHLAPLLLLAGCASEGPERVVERRVSDAPAPRGAALLRAAMLDGHTRVRAAVGLPPLTWDEALVASAARYAGQLATSGQFRHAEQPLGGPTREGENLWTGTRDAYRYDEMLGHWAAERDRFSNVAVPGSSTTGTFGDVGHYSQMVWRGSTRIGCAIASSRRADYLVCRYAPTGNVFGERAY